MRGWLKSEARGGAGGDSPGKKINNTQTKTKTTQKNQEHK